MERNAVSAIAVLGERTRTIGKDNDLIWKGLKADLDRFRILTWGRIVIMGRKTWWSLPPKHRPLRNRNCFVLTRDPSASFAGATPFRTLEEALCMAQWLDCGEIFIIGGAELYDKALPLVTRLYLTQVDDDTPGNTFFPDYSEFSKVVSSEVVKSNIHPQLTFEVRERP